MLTFTVGSHAANQLATHFVCHRSLSEMQIALDTLCYLCAYSHTQRDGPGSTLFPLSMIQQFSHPYPAHNPTVPQQSVCLLHTTPPFLIILPAPRFLPSKYSPLLQNFVAGQTPDHRLIEQDTSLPTTPIQTACQKRYANYAHMPHMPTLSFFFVSNGLISCSNLRPTVRVPSFQCWLPSACMSDNPCNF